MNQLTTQKNYRSKLIACIVALVTMLTILMIATPSAFAEGTSDLVANGGYRPYTERYNSATLGQQRMFVMHVYLKQGETVYLGTSVANAKLYNTNNGVNSDWLFSNGAMGTSYSDAQLAYVNTADVYVAQGNYGNIADAIGDGMTPGKNGVALIDLASDATNTTPGYIYDSTQEKGKVDLSGSGAGYKVTDKNTISSSTAGYVAGAKTNANTFTASSDGIYTVVFFSSAHTGENPVKVKADNTTPFAKTQKGGTIASWDISVYNGSTLQTGRVFTSTLFINMGGNVLSNGVSQGSLYANVYAVTDDGYQYKVDFNGMDPFGFVFFANNRGLLNTDGAAENPVTSSLYHGLRSDNNTLSDVSSHNVLLNNTPTDSTLDRTYNLFYEKPSSDALGGDNGLGISNPSTSGNITGFTFTGNEGTGTASNEGYVGQGGTFSFTVDSVSATSYEIDLNFGEGNTVVLSNTLKSGINSIKWDGKDAKGDIVPAGKYDANNISVKLKGGEVHFPLLDVEQNPNGVKVTRLNGEGTDSEKATVYYNNSSLNAGDATSPWTTEKNWEVGSQTDALSGIDSSNGAMVFTNQNTANRAKGMNLLGDGDQSALDLWAYYNTTATPTGAQFRLVDTSFTVTKKWDNTAGLPAAGNPSVTMTLYNSNGVKVAKDATGKAITNPVTVSADSKDVRGNAWAQTWEHLDPAQTYYVTETPITGYTTTNSGKGATVGGSIADGYTQNVTNTYVPTKLTIAKIWNHGTEAEEPSANWPSSVTIHVYTDAAKTHEIEDSPFTLTSASIDESGNKWALTITGLDSTLSYYCYEDKVTGYNSSTGGLASGSATSGYKSTFTNTFESKTYAYAQVLKQWSNDIIDGVSYRPASVTMTLVNKDTGAAITKDAAGKAISPVTLTADNSWYYAWPMLPKTDAAGKTINYNIVETVPAGYAKATEPTDPPLVIGNLTSVIFDNTYVPTTFTVTKTWKNGVNANQPTSTTVQLQQSLDGGNNWADYGDAQTLDAAGSWKHEWSGLPSYDSDGKVIAYRAIETPIDGYTTDEGTVGGNAADGYSQTITNTYDLTSLTVNKTWDYGMQAEADRPQSVNVALKDDKGTVTTAALNADNDWSYTFTGLPILEEGVYTVVEEPVDGYSSGSEMTGDAATGYSVALDNTYDYTAFTATKIWDHGIQDQADWPTSVALQLQKSTDGGTTYANEGSPVTLTSANADSAGNWTYTWSTLARDATYQVVETTPDGYSATASEVTGSATTGWAQSITNTFTNVTSLSVNKVWEHGTQDSADYPTYIEVQLYADGQQYGKAVTITADDGWIHTWPALDASKTYTLKETTVAGYTTSGGTVSGTKATGLTATFTNTYNEPVVPVEPGSVVPDAVTPSSVAPDTGDAFGMLVGALVGVLALGAGAVLIARSKRRRS